MKRFLGIPRQSLVAAVAIVLAALLTVPWTFWIIFAAYQRDIDQKVARLADRIRIHLSSSTLWRPDQVLEPIHTELMGDNTVQAVCYLDYSRGTGGYVARSKEIPIPRSIEEAQQLLNADGLSYRTIYQIKTTAGITGVVYIDLSRDKLRDHFWTTEGPLLRRVGVQTAAATLILGAAGVMAFRFWGSATRQREQATLQQQGLLAERGLTAAVLAHEIRNPLQALRFQLHSLRRNAGEPQRVNATADTIDSELSRIQQLVQDYLAHERAQAFRIAPVSLTSAAAGLQTLLAEMLRESGTRLTISSVNDAVVSCDPHALRQILMNLVLNAQQAMGRDGTITIRITRADGFGVISVSDTGPGIPPEIKERLFKPFQTSKKEGSGIGLALVKRFADNFGGSVSVDSEPGHGATFHLRLPLSDQPETSLSAPTPTAPNPAAV